MGLLLSYCRLSFHFLALLFLCGFSVISVLGMQIRPPLFSVGQQPSINHLSCFTCEPCLYSTMGFHTFHRPETSRKSYSWEIFVRGGTHTDTILILTFSNEILSVFVIRRWGLLNCFVRFNSIPTAKLGLIFLSCVTFLNFSNCFFFFLFFFILEIWLAHLHWANLGFT